MHQAAIDSAVREGRLLRAKHAHSSLPGRFDPVVFRGWIAEGQAHSGRPGRAALTYAVTALRHRSRPDARRALRSRRCARSACAARTSAGSPTAARRTGSRSARSRVNLVYIISAFRLPEQLVRLVTRLRTENATFLVHIDKKASPEIFGAVAEGVRSLPDGPLARSSRLRLGQLRSRGHLAGRDRSDRGQRHPLRSGSTPDGTGFPAQEQRRDQGLSRAPSRPFVPVVLPVPENEEWMPDGGLDRIDRWYFWARGRSLQVPSTRGQGWLGPAMTRIGRVMPRRRFLPGCGRTADQVTGASREMRSPSFTDTSGTTLSSSPSSAARSSPTSCSSRPSSSTPS